MALSGSCAATRLAPMSFMLARTKRETLASATLKDRGFSGRKYRVLAAVALA
jgi:hypothetical protein